jgi:Fibronectin type III domain
METGKPQIIDKTDNSVTLSWIRSNAIGASSLLGYTVEMFGRNSTEGWVQVASRVQNTTFQVVGLSSGITYYFSVRAENSHGMSGPSQLSEPITMGVVSEPFLLAVDRCSCCSRCLQTRRARKTTKLSINHPFVWLSDDKIVGPHLKKVNFSAASSAFHPNGVPFHGHPHHRVHSLARECSM